MLFRSLYWQFTGDGECSRTLEPFIGKEYKEGDIFCHIQTKWGEIIPVPAALGGKVVEIVAKQGKQIRRGDTIAWIEREK